MIDSRKLFLAFLVFWVLSGILNTFFQEAKKEVTPADFKIVLQEDKFQELTFYPEVVHGKLKNPINGFTVFYARPVTLLEREAIRDLAEKQKVPYRGAADMSFFWGVASNFLFMVLLWLLLAAMLRGQARGLQDFSKSRARLYGANNKKVTFSDVAGCDGAKEELQEVVAFLKNPGQFARLGAKIPKGVLLYGDPGTGKTLLARAVAGEAGVAFLSTSGSEFVEMFVGVGASRVRELFAQARKLAPCVIFIDEIDAVGRSRSVGLGGAHEEREQTLDALLTELDGFTPNDRLVVVAATNRPDILDRALVRPGRFDRQIQVDRPNIQGREMILKIHTKGVKLSPEVNLLEVAKDTAGMVGADLENTVNEAVLLATRKGKEFVEQSDFSEAVDKVSMGAMRKSAKLTSREKQITAYHEAGHTLAAKLTKHADSVHKVTIIPRGPALGFTKQLPEDDRYLHTKSQLEAMVTVCVAGRAAEELVFSEITTGAASDFQKATEILRKMIYELGMFEDTGLVVHREKTDFWGNPSGLDASQRTKEALEKILKDKLESIYKEVKQLLEKNRSKLDALAAALLEKETLSASEIDQALNSA